MCGMGECSFGHSDIRDVFSYYAGLPIAIMQANEKGKREGLPGKKAIVAYLGLGRMNRPKHAS